MGKIAKEEIGRLFQFTGNKNVGILRVYEFNEFKRIDEFNRLLRKKIVTWWAIERKVAKRFGVNVENPTTGI